MHREETPGEALYGLANQFEAKGDREAWRDTLRYLVARYPNSRFAKMAKQDLADQTEGENPEAATPEPSPQAERAADGEDRASAGQGNGATDAPR